METLFRALTLVRNEDSTPPTHPALIFPAFFSYICSSSCVHILALISRDGRSLSCQHLWWWTSLGHTSLVLQCPNLSDISTCIFSYIFLI